MSKPPDNAANPKAPKNQSADPGDGFSLSSGEQDEVEEKRPPRAAVLHEIIRSNGEQELKRSAIAIGWSSLAAGLSMGFSMLARGVLNQHLAHVPGGDLIAGLGYSFGFLLVVISRQQLFTENTMTAVLPLMTEPTLKNLGCLLRLWSVVLVGNIVGCALFSWGLLNLDQFDNATQNAFVALGESLMKNTPWQMFTKGIFAGWLIAMMVWMMAATKSARFIIIVVITWVIAISGFTHIIVGSVESLYLVFAGKLAFTDFVMHFALPTLAGNIVGGSLIFALVSHAQVRSDVD